MFYVFSIWYSHFVGYIYKAYKFKLSILGATRIRSKNAEYEVDQFNSVTFN